MQLDTMKEMLGAGFHFGHQTSRWNPNMRRFIYAEMGGIHIIDLETAAQCLESAKDFSREVSERGGVFLFTGTKKQSSDRVREVAEASDMPYVNHRWLGGLLTNFETIKKRINRLHELDNLKEDGRLELLHKKEQLALEAERQKLDKNLGGVQNLERLPDAVVIVDVGAEEIAAKEAYRLGIPIIALVDTNCDPSEVEYVVPGNDDSIRSCSLFLDAIGDEVKKGSSKYLRKQEDDRKQAEEKAKLEAEERAKREAEQKQKREDDAKKEEQRLAQRATEIEAKEEPKQEVKQEADAPATDDDREVQQEEPTEEPTDKPEMPEAEADVNQDIEDPKEEEK